MGVPPTGNYIVRWGRAQPGMPPHAGSFGFPHVIATPYLIRGWQSRRRSNDGSPARAQPQRDCHVAALLAMTTERPCRLTCTHFVKLNWPTVIARSGGNGFLHGWAWAIAYEITATSLRRKPESRACNLLDFRNETTDFGHWIPAFAGMTVVAGMTAIKPSICHSPDGWVVMV